MNRRSINIILLVAVILFLVAIFIFSRMAGDVHPDETTAPKSRPPSSVKPRHKTLIEQAQDDDTLTDAPEPHAPRRLLIFDTALGRMSNQLLTMTAAMALANRLNRTAVLPPLFLGGGKGGGGSRVVPLTEAFDFEAWRTKHDPRLYCDPNPTHDHRFDGQPPMCFVLEHELDWLDFFGLDHRDKAARAALSAKLGCMRMKGVQLHPLRRKQRPIFECADESTRPVTSKKRLSDVLKAAGELAAKPILFVPLAMYVSDSLEPLVIRAWSAFTPSIALREVENKCRSRLLSVPSRSSSAADSEIAVVSVGIHLRMLEGSCRDRVQQVIREAKLLSSGGSAPPHAAALLEKHCSLKPSDVVEIVEASDSVKQACSADKYSSIKKCPISIAVADDGQAPEMKKKFLDALRSSFPHGVVNSLSVCHDLTIAALPVAASGDDSRSAPSWLASNDGIAKGTLALLIDFWQLDLSDVFIGNQLSTVSINVCRHRLALEKSCANFVSPHSAAVGQKKKEAEV